MTDFGPFVQSNLPWVIAFFVLLLIYVIFEWQVSSKKAVCVSPRDAVLLMNKKNTLTFDLRSSEQFSHAHISRARSLPKPVLQELPNHLNKHKKSTLLLVCDSGRLARQAAALLKSNGFSALALQGGMMAWRNEQLPTEGSHA